MGVLGKNFLSCSTPASTAPGEKFHSINLKPSAQLHFVGVNYKSSPIEVREKFSFLSHELDRALNEFNSQIGATVILSTCNRSEFYISSTLSPEEVKQKTCQLIASLKDLNENLIYEHCISSFSSKAVEHLFKVTSGLESMILGEGQILNQVKTAYQNASSYADATLNQLFQKALAAGKRVRTETNISKGAMSVPSAALQVIQEKLSPKELSEQNIMILGSGQVAELCLDHLHSQGASKNITLVHRSESHSLQVTKYGISQAINYSQLYESITAQDIVLVCTSAPHYVIQPSHVLAHPQPLIVADMSLPRNVNPELALIPGIELIDLDYLQKTVSCNLASRSSEMAKANSLLEEEIIKFEQWQINKSKYENSHSVT